MLVTSDKKMPICITGGNGFIGQYLVRQLLQEGYSSISIADRNLPPKEIVSKINFIKGNFSDKKVLTKILSPGCVVIHLAGTSNQATAENDPIADAETSIIGTLKLLEAAAGRKISKFVFMSSAPAIYGHARKLPVATDALPQPRSVYGAMKLSLEHYVSHYAERYGFSYVILRSANAYGPGQFTMTHGVVSKFAYKILTGAPVEIWGPPNMKRDFIFVEDVARAIAASIKPKVKNVTLNVASGRKTTLGELVRNVEKASGIKARVEVKEMRLIDVPDLYFSIKETTRLLRWKPQTSLAYGVEQTVNWIRKSVQNGMGK